METARILRIAVERLRELLRLVWRTRSRSRRADDHFNGYL